MSILYRDSVISRSVNHFGPDPERIPQGDPTSLNKAPIFGTSVVANTIHQKNAVRDISSTLDVASISESFKSLQNSIQRLIIGQMRKTDNHIKSFERFDNSFSNFFGITYKVSENRNLLAGYFMSIVASELHHFYSDLRSDKESTASDWETMYIKFRGGDAGIKAYIGKLNDQVKEELDSLLKDLFSLSQEDVISASGTISNDIVFLIIKCLATGTKPFLAEPGPHGYDPKQVNFTAEHEDMQTDQNLAFILFPSFWSAERGNQVIFRSNLVCVRK
jgi:hypothetical protein